MEISLAYAESSKMMRHVSFMYQVLNTELISTPYEVGRGPGVCSIRLYSKSGKLENRLNQNEFCSFDMTSMCGEILEPKTIIPDIMCMYSVTYGVHTGLVYGTYDLNLTIRTPGLVYVCMYHKLYVLLCT